MSDSPKTPDRLPQELSALRARVGDLEEAEKALRASEQKYRHLFENLTDAALVADAETGVILESNRRAEILLGRARDEIIGMHQSELHPPDQAKAYRQRFAAHVATGHAADFDGEVIRKDGRVVPVMISGEPLTLSGRRLILGLFRNMSDRKRAEQLLRESELRYRQLFDDAPVGYHELDTEGRITRVNRTELRMLGYAAEEMLGRPVWEFVVETEASREAVAAKLSGATEPGRGFERTLRRKDGTTLPVLIEDRLLRDEQGRITGIRSTIQDITERKRAEETTIRAKEEWERTFHAVPDLIAILDRDYRIVRVNQAMADRLGTAPEEVVGLKCYECVHGTEAPPPFCPNRQLMELGEERTAEVREGRLGGDFVVTVSPLHDAGNQLIGSVHIARDITKRKRAQEERRQLEAQIQHAQKLESLGVLAGGIAHDFNNLLVGILGNASLSLTALPAESPARYSIEQIEKAAQRATELTNQMLAYSGKGKFVVQPLSVSTAVEEMAHLLEAAIPKKVALRYDFADGLPAIEADVTQIRQVVMNLITNAAEAIGDEGGIITVSTSAVEADRAYLSGCYVDDELPEGSYVCLAVSDTGRGMGEATKAKLFDPFFTTKSAGRGLGMAAVLGIVRGHGGAIKVHSEPGKGATFEVLFPGSDRPIEDAEARPKETAQWMASGTALVVDDEASVRAVAGQMLEQAGFTVITAENGREGIEIFRGHADEIVVVLLDMTMPDMGGDEAFRELRRIRQDVKVILSSGYDEQDATSRFAGKGLAGFIQKPYTMEALLTKLRGLLGD